MSKLQKGRWFYSNIFWNHGLAPGYACLRMGRPWSPSEGKNSLWIQDKRRKLEENLKIFFKSTVSYDVSDFYIVETSWNIWPKIAWFEWSKWCVLIIFGFKSSPQRRQFDRYSPDWSSNQSRGCLDGTTAYTTQVLLENCDLLSFQPTRISWERNVGVSNPEQGSLLEWLRAHQP